MIRRAIGVGVVLVAATALAGCEHAPAPAYQPGIANLQSLRIGTTPIAVDDFAADPGVNDRRLGVRAGSIFGSGSDGAFSTYLQRALEAELRNAGRLDTAASLRLSGTLAENRLDANGLSIGRASVAARFVLTREGRVVYDKVHRADHAWESSFIGAIAIPAATQGYVATVQMLTGRLFADPAFIQATR